MKRFINSLLKDIKIFLKKKNIENQNMVTNDITISQKTKKQILVEYRNDIMKHTKNKNLL